MDSKLGSYMREEEPPLPSETSVEAALNSRCSSDYDSDPKSAHWGMYNADEPVPLEHLRALEKGVQVPRFTRYQLSVNFDERPIVLSMSDAAAGVEREWLHVESGMQHQAVHLVCAALGMGTCIYNLGTEGKHVGGALWGTARMGLEMMRPCYDGALWSTKPPDDWVSDASLPDPRRDGDVPLLQAMEDISTSAEGRPAEWQDISQLLWAVRGRTPHLSLGRRWGLTIPTWAGGQDIAGLCLIAGDGVFRYVNWRDDKPAHALERAGDPPRESEPGAIQIAMVVNEDKARGLWEVGYMLEDLFVQAGSLGVRYEAELLDSAGRDTYQAAGVPNARAVFTVYSE